MWFKVKNTLFSTYCTLFLLLYAPPFWNAPIFTKLIVLRCEVCSDWPAISALWLAEYLKHGIEMLHPLPYCDDVSRHDETKTMKPIISEAFVTSTGDNYWLYWLILSFYALCVSRLVNQHVCIEETTNNKLKDCSKLAFESSMANSLNMKTYLQAVSQKRQTVLVKLELPHFIETVFVHRWCCRLLFHVSGNSPL